MFPVGQGASMNHVSHGKITVRMMVDLLCSPPGGEFIIFMTNFAVLTT